MRRATLSTAPSRSRIVTPPSPSTRASACTLMMRDLGPGDSAMALFPDDVQFDAPGSGPKLRRPGIEGMQKAVQSLAGHAVVFQTVDQRGDVRRLRGAVAAVAAAVVVHAQ